MNLGGTVWLEQLRRKAYQDGRILLVETSVIAMLTGVLNAMREVSTEEYYRLEFPPGPLIAGGLIGLALWLAAGIPLFTWAQRACSWWAQDVLAESGLLYLALEHEPGEQLPMFNPRRPLQRLAAGPAGTLSFRQRIQLMLAKYVPAANALGWPAYPALVRRAATLTNMALGGVLVFYIMLVHNEIRAAQFDSDPRVLMLLHYFTAIVALILVRATLQLGRATGLRLGLCTMLLGEGQGL